MEPKFQRRVQRYGWDKAAGYYENAWHRQLAEAQHRLLELADPQPGERVLDIACGTGLVTFPAAGRVGPEGEVVGTDISQEMVINAGGKAGARGFQNVTFERMDAEALDFPDGSFDLALCSLGLMFLPEPANCLREMHRVLRPGGRAAVLVWGHRGQCGWAEVFPIVDARVKSEVCPLFFRLGGEGVLEKEMAGAGFAGVRGERFSYPLEYDDDEEACMAAFQGAAVALAYHRFDEHTQSGVEAEYLESISPYRNGAGYRIPGEFVAAAGEKPG